MILTDALNDYMAHPRHVLNKIDRYGYTHAKLAENRECKDAVFLLLRVDNDRIIDGRYRHEGCTISRASADILVENIRGLSLAQARERAEQFLDAVQRVSGNSFDSQILNDLAIMTMNRQNCVVLPWVALLELTRSEEAKDD